MFRKGNRKFEESRDPLVVSVFSAGALFASLVAAIGGWIGYSALRVNHRVNMPRAIEAEQQTFTSANAGNLVYYKSADVPGTPLVLIHSINAGASAYEMRPLFEHYRTSRPVYALDLPGFGFSDRTKHTYSPRLYTDAIRDFLHTQVGGPADVVALSLGSEFVARAALEEPGLIRSLTMISPSGFDEPKKRANQNRSQMLYRLFSFPLWSQAFYDLLATRPASIFSLNRVSRAKLIKGWRNTLI
jgi:pimeloyl-ACP methyl ester carboxylesterase